MKNFFIEKKTNVFFTNSTFEPFVLDRKVLLPNINGMSNSRVVNNLQFPSCDSFCVPLYIHIYCKTSNPCIIRIKIRLLRFIFLGSIHPSCVWNLVILISKIRRCWSSPKWYFNYFEFEVPGNECVRGGFRESRRNRHMWRHCQNSHSINSGDRSKDWREAVGGDQSSITLPISETPPKPIPLLLIPM